MTCGAATEVPDVSIVRPASQVDLMFTPGAYTLMQLPQFENSAFVSFTVDAATVKAPLAPPASRQASELWLAAVATTKTPEFQRLCTASVNAGEGSSETDKFTTAGLA